MWSIEGLFVAGIAVLGGLWVVLRLLAWGIEWLGVRPHLLPGYKRGFEDGLAVFTGCRCSQCMVDGGASGSTPGHRGPHLALVAWKDDAQAPGQPDDTVTRQWAR